MGLVDRKVPGKPPRLTPEQRAALMQAVEAGPEPELHGVVRWRLVDLVQWLRDEFDVSLSRQTLGRELRRMGFRKLSARPQDRAQDPEALEAFKKTFPPSWRRSGRRCPPETPIEVWWQDEARVGQKNGITRRWARRGSRPRAPHDQRTTWALAIVLGPMADEARSSARSARPRARRRAW